MRGGEEERKGGGEEKGRRLEEGRTTGKRAACARARHLEFGKQVDVWIVLVGCSARPSPRRDTKDRTTCAGCLMLYG